ncbi:MAG: SPOR domain-containing protein [Terriglobales bacterium]
MPTGQQDTEITLGTGRMLVLFFTFVLVCAVFFSIGFSLGRKTTMLGANNLVNASTGTPAAVVRPSAAKQNAPQPTAQTTDFSFYKSVGAKSTDTELSPPESAAQVPSTTTEPPKTVTPTVNPSAVAGGYFVQVAAVSRQEDAAALVEALKRKQYPAFTANNSAADKFYHVQVGPYADLKEAEGMRTRLIADGYNPIVKK